VWAGVGCGRQSPVSVSQSPVMMVWLLLLTVTVCLLKVVMHLASHSFPIDTRELCLRAGMTWASLACSGKLGMSS
jgi:hypothetical protein